MAVASLPLLSYVPPPARARVSAAKDVEAVASAPLIRLEQEAFEHGLLIPKAASMSIRAKA